MCNDEEFVRFSFHHCRLQKPPLSLTLVQLQDGHFSEGLSLEQQVVIHTLWVLLQNRITVDRKAHEVLRERTDAVPFEG